MLESYVGVWIWLCCSALNLLRLRDFNTTSRFRVVAWIQLCSVRSKCSCWALAASELHSAQLFWRTLHWSSCESWLTTASVFLLGGQQKGFCTESEGWAGWWSLKKAGRMLSAGKLAGFYPPLPLAGLFAGGEEGSEFSCRDLGYFWEELEKRTLPGCLALLHGVCLHAGTVPFAMSEKNLAVWGLTTSNLHLLTDILIFNSGSQLCYSLSGARFLAGDALGRRLMAQFGCSPRLPVQDEQFCSWSKRED